MKTFQLNGQTWRFDPHTRWLYSPEGKVSFLRYCWNGTWQASQWDGVSEDLQPLVLEALNELFK